MQYCFPFELYIEESSNNKPVVKIRPYETCLNIVSYKNRILDYINSHSNISLKTINGSDPFDFIQNFSYLPT